MRKFSILLAGLIIAAIMIIPVMADTTTQNAAGVIVGNDNTQIVNNDNNQVEQNAHSVANGGHDNTVVSQNVNGNLVNGNVVNGATSVNNEQNVALYFPAGKASYAGLDAGTVSSYVVSLYEGQSLVTMNDANSEREVMSNVGDVYKYSIRSSVPVLAYVVNANDADKAEWDLNCAPTYDPFMHKFELGNLVPIYLNKVRSPSQSFEVTIKEPGRYALVIDTRVSHRLDGKMSTITDDSVDVSYFIERTPYNGTPIKEEKNYTGRTEIFKTLDNGAADTTKNVVINAF